MKIDSGWMVHEDQDLITFTRMYMDIFLEIKLDHGSLSTLIFEGTATRSGEATPSIAVTSPSFYGCFDHLINYFHDGRNFK